MTKREKTLLFILALIIITICPYYFITQHVVAANRESDEKLQLLAIQKQSYDLKRASISNLKKVEEEKKKEIDKIIFAQPNPNKSYEAHYIFTGFAQEAGISIRSLSIGDFTKLDLSEKVTDDTAAVPVSTGQNPKAGTQAEGNNSAYGFLQPYKLQIDVTVVGGYSNILSFIDKINNYGADFIIESFSVEDLTKGAGVEGQLKITAYVLLTEAERSQIQ